jgi:iron complex outermembrane receptor protein
MILTTKHSLFVGASVACLVAAHAQTAAAAEAAATAAGPVVEEVIVTGTRQTGMKAADSAAPIQVLGATALKQVAQPDLIQALAQNLPSFNAQGFGGDAANLTLSAALRGLNPNDTLVLINGKRRHTTANLAVLGGSPYSGSATSDLGLIPVGAIDHIEVLQDGAAAQYGSDAIAGVVNIILKSASSGGVATVTGGKYFENGGDSAAWSFNNGMKLGESGFLNFTLEQRYHDFSRQGGADRRLFTAAGVLKSTVNAVDAGVLNQPGSPNVNNINGDPHYNIYNAFFNAGYDLGGGIQVYATGSYSHRNADSYENYRVPTKIKGVTSTGVTYYPLPTGFNPTETLAEDDFAFTAGVKGEVDGWSWDLSSTYGQDADKIYTNNSANAQLFPVLAAASATPIIPQRDFYDGQFKSSEWTTNLDFVKAFNLTGMASPLNFAFGFEYRQNKYSIESGEPSSYYGAGAQSFTGYDPSNAGEHQRHDYSGYVDLALDPIKNLHLDVAGRYSNYSDFGEATVGKLTGRYDFSPMFALRGTVSTGFRAPTLAEEFYSGTNVSPSSATVQLPANSPSAVIAGFSPLKAETSNNYSIGFVAHPMDRLQVTLDAYQIDIAKRIQTTGFLYGSVVVGGVNQVISQAILNAITAHGNTLDSGISYAGISVFTNAVDTRTKGAELTVTYSSDFGEYGHVDWTAGFNYNETKVTKQAPLPTQDLSAKPAIITQTALLSPNALTGLTTANPKWKVVAGAYWTLDKWSANLRETIYGESSELTSTGNVTTNLKIGVAPITDLTVAYKVTDSIKIEAGANNLFDQRPPNVPFLSALGRPADGGNVYDHPMTFSPYGINGGYYYGRLTVTF